MNKLYDFCNTCYLKNDCRRLTGELDNSKMLTDFCFPHKVALHNLKKANIPLRFQSARPSDYPDGSPLREHVDEAVYRLLNESCSVSLCYLGKVTGTGKTHCAATVANHYLINTIRKRIEAKDSLFQDYPLVYFVDYAMWVDLLRDRYNGSYDEEAIKNAFDVPLLVLDDLGSGKMSDYAREQTNILINHRYSNNLSTIITSNLSLDEMADPTVLGRRVVSRISDSAEIVEFNLTDRRTRKRTLHIGE